MRFDVGQRRVALPVAVGIAALGVLALLVGGRGSSAAADEVNGLHATGSKPLGESAIELTDATTPQKRDERATEPDALPVQAAIEGARPSRRPDELLAEATVAELREALAGAYFLYSSMDGTPAAGGWLSVDSRDEHQWSFVNGKARFVFDKGEFPTYDLARERHARFQDGESVEPASVAERRLYEEFYERARSLLE